MLGHGWTGVSAYVKPFAIYGAISVACDPLGPLLFYRGFARMQTMVVWLEFIVFIVSGWLFYLNAGLVGLVYGRIFSAVFHQACNLHIARRHCELSLRQSFSAVWRPASGAVLMYELVAWLDTQMLLQGAGELMRLAGGVCLGACFYLFWIWASWRTAGSPAGLEEMALSFVQRRRYE